MGRLRAVKPRLRTAPARLAIAPAPGWPKGAGGAPSEGRGAPHAKQALAQVIRACPGAGGPLMRGLRTRRLPVVRRSHSRGEGRRRRLRRGEHQSALWQLPRKEDGGAAAGAGRRVSLCRARRDRVRLGRCTAGGFGLHLRTGAAGPAGADGRTSGRRRRDRVCGREPGFGAGGLNARRPAIANTRARGRERVRVGKPWDGGVTGFAGAVCARSGAPGRLGGGPRRAVSDDVGRLWAPAPASLGRLRRRRGVVASVAPAPIRMFASSQRQGRRRRGRGRQP